MEITKVEYEDGLTYVHTQLSDDSAEIAAAMEPYIGRRMSAYMSNGRGHYNWATVTLVSVDEEEVTIRNNHGEFTLPANEVFGSSTTVYAED